MAAGACVLRAATKTRGYVWRVKYVDAAGKQVMETLGPERDGWTRKKAQAELRARLVAVEREGYRKPVPMTFESFGRRWVTEHCDRRGLKRSTRRGYEAILERLIFAFAGLRLDEIDAGTVERFIAGASRGSSGRKAGKRRRDPLAPRTVNRHLNVLHALLDAAVRQGLVRSNAVEFVDRPREPRDQSWRILSPAEIVAVEAAFVEMIDEADRDTERAWRELARVIFVVAVATGMRSGELRGLKWRRVHLADPDGARLEVAETFVRGRQDTPKSRRSVRTIALGRKVADELFAWRGRTAFAGDDEHVFASPTSGRPFDPGKYAEVFRYALERAGIEGRVRPLHDLRHTSITNGAIAGTHPTALMARAGHSSFATTLIYLRLGGELFAEEAERLEERLWGDPGRKPRYKTAPEAHTALAADPAKAAL
jgi:integrase